jgi:hypothetical protein
MRLSELPLGIIEVFVNFFQNVHCEKVWFGKETHDQRLDLDVVDVNKHLLCTRQNLIKSLYVCFDLVLCAKIERCVKNLTSYGSKHWFFLRMKNLRNMTFCTSVGLLPLENLQLQTLTSIVISRSPNEHMCWADMKDRAVHYWDPTPKILPPNLTSLIINKPFDARFVYPQTLTKLRACQFCLSDFAVLPTSLTSLKIDTISQLILDGDNKIIELMPHFKINLPNLLEFKLEHYGFSLPCDPPQLINPNQLARDILCSLPQNLLTLHIDTYTNFTSEDCLNFPQSLTNISVDLSDHLSVGEYVRTLPKTTTELELHTWENDDPMATILDIIETLPKLKILRFKNIIVKLTPEELIKIPQLDKLYALYHDGYCYDIICYSRTEGILVSDVPS